VEFSVTTTGCLLICVLLMFLNWGLEAKKWQLLVGTYEKISWLQSFQSILAGITISIFTPNRVGEFTGRIFFLKEADKLKASVKSMLGSFLQLSVTFIAGFIAMGLYIQLGYDKVVPLFSIFNKQKNDVLLLIGCILLIIFLFLFRLSFFARLKHQFKEILTTGKSELMNVFALSVCRYLVFTLQYYLLIRALDVEIGMGTAFILIALTFFITSVIPSFALTEIIVRSAVAVYIFSILDPAQPLSIATASFLLWIINLAIPAIAGSIFIGKLQFFKSY
jgi:uncharacterized membrane protein YbhN (UPF0104 family)